MTTRKRDPFEDETPAVSHVPAVTKLSDLTPHMWIVAILTFGFGDILTTFIGLRAGIAVEASPISALLIAENGVGFIYVVKFALVVMFYVLWRVTPRPHRIGIPLGLCLLGIGVTLWNLGVLIAAGNIHSIWM